MSNKQDLEVTQVPEPYIGDDLLRYLDTIASVDRYKEIQTEAQLHNMHGQMRIIDHLKNLHANQ